MVSSPFFRVTFKVYVAGILIPESTVSITSAFNACPTCVITMPPDPGLIGIGRRDRIPVQVYVSDTLTAPQAAVSDDDLTYLLLFDGVVANYGYKSDEMGKALTISAESVMNVFKTASVRILTSMDAVKNNQMSQQYQGSAVSTNLMFPSSLFMYGLGDGGAPANHPYDFLKNAVDFLMQDSQSPVTEFYASYFATDGKGGLNMPNRLARVPFLIRPVSFSLY